jgi:hypothetical protein
MTDTQSEKKSVLVAFMDLEADICDLLYAAKLARELAMDQGKEIDDLLYFSIRQCESHAEALKGKYYGLWRETVNADGVSETPN